jgi:DNA ligase (NAD+)
MNAIELDMMRGMVSILNEASNAYYNTGRPIMTDEQFDARLADLKQLEEETGFVLSNSPTQNVGYKVLTELKEVEHSYPMLSLDKCHTVEELIKFANNKELVASIKLDGLTCRLTYENGVLVRAETRGNGHVGSDITEHVKQFKNVPLKINKEGTYIIDGEAIITDDDFAEVNKDGEYKNSRNLASGTLSVLDTSLVAQRRLRLLGWDVIEGGCNSLKDNLNKARELGFDVVPYWFTINLEPKKLDSTITYIFEYAKEEGLPCDGIVFKFNDIEYGKSLGATSHHFRNGIAYKAKDEVYETKLVDVEFTMGKTGVLTPTAVFEPVEIDGTIVEKASLHNISVMDAILGKRPYKGQKIWVKKSNMIIPQIVRSERND